MGEYNRGPRNFNSDNRRSDSGRSFGSGNNRFSSGGNRGFNDGPKEMHKAVCSDCGNECEVPFKPTSGKPVYCKDCYAKHKPKREFSPRGNFKPRRDY